jgi:hypothetical protein
LQSQGGGYLSPDNNSKRRAKILYNFVGRPIDHGIRLSQRFGRAGVIDAIADTGFSAILWLARWRATLVWF